MVSGVFRDLKPVVKLEAKAVWWGEGGAGILKKAKEHKQKREARGNFLTPARSH